MKLRYFLPFLLLVAACDGSALLDNPEVGPIGIIDPVPVIDLEEQTQAENVAIKEEIILEDKEETVATPQVGDSCGPIEEECTINSMGTCVCPTDDNEGSADIDTDTNADADADADADEICEQEKIYNGNYIVNSKADWLNLAKYCAIEGGIKVENLDIYQLSNLSLRHISGQLNVNDNANLDVIFFQNLKSLGNILVTGNKDLLGIAFPQLEQINGPVMIGDNQSLNYEDLTLSTDMSSEERASQLREYAKSTNGTLDFSMVNHVGMGVWIEGNFIPVYNAAPTYETVDAVFPCQNDYQCGDEWVCDQDEKICREPQEGDVELHRGSGGAIVLAKADKGVFYSRITSHSEFWGTQIIEMNCATNPVGAYSPAYDEMLIFCIGSDKQMRVIAGKNDKFNSSIKKIGPATLSTGTNPVAVTDADNGDVYVFARNTEGYIVKMLGMHNSAGSSMDWGQLYTDEFSNHYDGHVDTFGIYPTGGQLAAMMDPTRDRVHVFVHGGKGYDYNAFIRSKLLHYSGYRNNWGGAGNEEVMGSFDDTFDDQFSVALNEDTGRLEIFGRAYNNSTVVKHWSCNIKDAFGDYLWTSNFCELNDLPLSNGGYAGNPQTRAVYDHGSEKIELFRWNSNSDGLLHHPRLNSSNTWSQNATKITSMGDTNVFAKAPAIVSDASIGKMFIINVEGDNGPSYL